MLHQRSTEMLPEQELVTPSAPQLEPAHSPPVQPARVSQRARQAPLALRREGARVLQRAIGNRGVRSLFQQGRLRPARLTNQVIQRCDNRTGLPNHLKDGLETLSGMSMDDVRVHYNSPRPAQLHALAYTKGTHIHVGPGQESHVPHEAWHVAQQKQGRVQPTLLVGDVEINDDARLENEADVLGRKSLTAGRQTTRPVQNKTAPGYSAPGETVQRLIINAGKHLLPQAGWVTLSTMDVALKQDSSQEIVEFGVEPQKAIGENENIYLLGHGSVGKVAHRNPKELGDYLKTLKLDNWKGKIIGLTCRAGQKPSNGKSGIEALSEELKGDLTGTAISGAKGPTLSHTAIESTGAVSGVRTSLPEKSYTKDIRKHYLTELEFTKKEKAKMLTTVFSKSAEVMEQSNKLDQTFAKNLHRVNTADADVSQIIDEKLKNKDLSTKAAESRSIDLEHQKIDALWDKYLQTNPKDIKEMAKKATKLSENFYKIIVEFGDRNDLLFKEEVESGQSVVLID